MFRILVDIAILYATIFLAIKIAIYLVDGTVL